MLWSCSAVFKHVSIVVPSFFVLVVDELCRLFSRSALRSGRTGYVYRPGVCFYVAVYLRCGLRSRFAIVCVWFYNMGGLFCL